MKLNSIIGTILTLWSVAGSGQFAVELDFTIEEIDMIPETIRFPPSPLTSQILFIGGHDIVQTTAMYGNPPGQALAKQRHDFIGFTPATAGDIADQGEVFLGFVTVSHELIASDPNIGDGGGMTVFAVKRDDTTGDLIILNRTLSDGRTGEFFNVDFVNTVGETQFNCGGITSPVDGRIWTGEELFQTSNASIYGGIQDTSDFLITTDIVGEFDGATIPAYQNCNYMVEIDPRQAVAIRKQYNWGRQPFEGGVILPDNQTVFLCADATPGYLTKFIADTPGDFTSGSLYVFSEPAADGWVEIDNSSLDNMINYMGLAATSGGTVFNRLEWAVHDSITGYVYISETGQDNPSGLWSPAFTAGADVADHHQARAALQGTTAGNNSYRDYYGRILRLDPVTNAISVLLEGGPEFSGEVYLSNYPDKHFSNPDGLNVMVVDGISYLIIQEDLNGTSNGRMPARITNPLCELFLLDLSLENPVVDDLVRLAAVPVGAEVTGACPTPDGKSLLVNSQHPAGNLEFPYNNSLTFVINGLDLLIVGLQEENETEFSPSFFAYPNPTLGTLNFNEISDVAIYSANGKRLKVYRNVKTIDISNLASGMYYVQNAEGLTQKVIVQ